LPNEKTAFIRFKDSTALGKNFGMRYHLPPMRSYRSIEVASLLVTVLAFTCSAIADRIHSAAEGLNCTAIEKILQEDPLLVNLRDSQGRTPLLCALDTIYGSGGGLKKTIDMLVANHANVGVRDNDGNTVLHYAVRQRIDIVKLFVGLDRNLVVATNKFQKTPLHTAVQLGENDIAEFLIVSGARMSARDKDGVTPLHIAAKSKNTEMVKLLLKYHADINARTNAGETPYTLAEYDRDSSLQRFIHKNGGHE
jgi:ankyrin repeat protein